MDSPARIFFRPVRSTGAVCILIFVQLILFSKTTSAETLVVASNANHPVSVGTAAMFHRDKTGKMTFEEVRALNDSEWMKPESPSLSFGFSSDVIWLKFVARSEDAADDFVLATSYPHLDRIAVYQPTDAGHYAMSEAGTLFHFSHRELFRKDLIFHLPLTNRESVIFVRVQSETAINCELNIWKMDALSKSWDRERLFDGIFYGIMLVMALYNFALFVSVRDINYLYYSAFQISAGLFSFGLEGYGYQYLFADLPEIGRQFTVIMGGFSTLFAIQFGQKFLRLDLHLPWLRRALLLTMALCAIPIFSLIVGFSLAIKAGTLLNLSASVFLLIGAVVCVIKGYRPARFFLVAWLGLLTFSMIFNLGRLGILPVNFFVEHGPQTGFALDALILSIALADRINQTRKEKEDALAEKGRLQATMLKRAIQPHFLLNSLNTLIGLLREDPKLAESLIISLSGELRTLLDKVESLTIELREEIALCNAHIRIMCLRHGVDHSFVTEGVTGSERVPPFVFHTLVENCFTHVTGEQLLAMKLERSSEKNRDIFTFSSNSMSSRAGVEGTGTRYIKSRLEEVYPGRWQLDQGPFKDGWRVTISIPTELQGQGV